jgi:hypothetical protein
MTENIPEGWGWPLAARRSHYFVRGTSLCGRWLYTGRLEDNQDATSKSDCLPCRRELAKRKTKETTNASH